MVWRLACLKSKEEMVIEFVTGAEARRDKTDTLLEVMVQELQLDLHMNGLRSHLRSGRSIGRKCPSTVCMEGTKWSQDDRVGRLL